MARAASTVSSETDPERADEGGDRIGVVAKAEIRYRVGGATAAGCVPGDDVVLTGQALQLGGPGAPVAQAAVQQHQGSPRPGTAVGNGPDGRLDPVHGHFLPSAGHYARGSHERTGASSDLPCRATSVPSLAMPGIAAPGFRRRAQTDKNPAGTRSSDPYL